MSTIGSSKAAPIIGAILVGLVGAFHIDDARGAPLTYASTASGVVGDSNILVVCTDDPEVSYFEGGPDQGTAFGNVAIDRNNPTVGFCHLKVLASSSASQAEGALDAVVIATGYGFGIASAELDTALRYIDLGLEVVPTAVIHVDADLVVTGTQGTASFTDWFGCAAANTPSGYIRSPDCFVHHYGDGSPVSTTLKLGFDVTLSYGVSADIELSYLIWATAYGAFNSNTGQPTTQTISLTHSADIRQTLPAGVTFESDSGFLSESRFNSPSPSVPEPSSLCLIGGGLAAVAAFRKHRWLRATLVNARTVQERQPDIQR